MSPQAKPSEGGPEPSWGESLKTLSDLLQEQYLKGPSGSIAKGKENRDNRDEVRAALVMVLSDQFESMLRAVTPSNQAPDTRQLSLFKKASETYFTQGPGLHAIDYFYTNADKTADLGAKLTELYNQILQNINVSFETRRHYEVPPSAVGEVVKDTRRRTGSGLTMDPHDLDMLSGRRTGRGAVGDEMEARRQARGGDDQERGAA